MPASLSVNTTHVDFHGTLFLDEYKLMLLALPPDGIMAGMDIVAMLPTDALFSDIAMLELWCADNDISIAATGGVWTFTRLPCNIAAATSSTVAIKLSAKSASVMPIPLPA